jgi:hypothetical protein
VVSLFRTFKNNPPLSKNKSHSKFNWRQYVMFLDIDIAANSGFGHSGRILNGRAGIEIFTLFRFRDGNGRTAEAGVISPQNTA